ncbi:acetoin dehydrogenase E2 subunit dihydrolipoyllysine-residue acetyltransferase [Bordetella ansorpii]|uniref:Acetoin dehydrogenase E2 subunit dihydrolipoyllysine-residue acetyltransferase n=1 Tax=Bordetella ansorpii TaxID=288768 RepID=A0A157SN08_9BORD|nr:alpha/beta hydrolase [Bordetella ansorpii]SAI71782.1 acetoin dehydrogenase E2 subunit dihydrolipoyllysine-residue acetyltransferase [Bordetella ansorpii]
MSVEAPQGLAAMHKPLLLIYGARDALVRAEASFQRARALNARITGQFYPEAGHAPFMEERQRFNRELSGFVEAAMRH